MEKKEHIMPPCVANFSLLTFQSFNNITKFKLNQVSDLQITFFLLQVCIYEHLHFNKCILFGLSCLYKKQRGQASHFIAEKFIYQSVGQYDGWMDDLRFYVLFNNSLDPLDQ